ncbi:MAG: DUF5808 domain-containing protein [Clostridium sp.]
MLLYLMLILLPTIIMVFTSFKNIRFGDNTLLFGVRLPVGFKINNNLQRVITSYKRANLTVAGLNFIISSLLIYVLPEEFIITVGVLSILGMSLSGFITFFIANKRVTTIKTNEKWEGYTKNIVIVDLNNKKEVKGMGTQWLAFLVPLGIIVLTFILMMISYNSLENTIVDLPSPVLFKDQVPFYSYIYPVYIQITMLIVLMLSGLMITKSKQIINGGEVEKIKQLNIILKKTNLFYMAVIASIVETIFLVIALGNVEASMGFALISVGVLIVMVIILTIYYENVISKYKKIDGDNIINKDDDRLYKFGMFYYNPNDPSNIVPKRVGAGSDFNYGKPIIRISSILGGVVLFIVLSFTAFYLPFDMGEKTPIVENNTIKIGGMYSIDINKKNILDVSLESLPEEIMKINGAGLENKLYGNFKINNSRDAKMYISNAKIKAVKITLKDGRIIYINHNDIEGTNKVYNLVKNFTK